MKLIDRYALQLMLWPLVGALSVTLVGLLLERVLRLLQLLSGSSNRFGSVAELVVNLLPHYLGLTLPAAFFIALFVVISRLNEGAEIEALLASGVSFTRLLAPYLGLGVVLMAISLVLFGFVQPYSRYAYRAALHAAESAGWNGMVQPQSFLSPDESLTMTVDAVDPTGRNLRRIFIRRVLSADREEVTTARSARLVRNPDGESVRVEMRDGQQLIITSNGEPRLLIFEGFDLELPLGGAARLLRARGGDERELTLLELANEARRDDSTLPRATLLAELCGRLARSVSLPLLPLLALPLGLTTKRGGRAPGVILASLLLLAFHHFVQFGQSLAVSGRAPAVLAVGAPFVAFAAVCLGTFLTSRKRPGETPVALFSERISEAIHRLRTRGEARAQGAA